jgi:hypothetical protein
MTIDAPATSVRDVVKIVRPFAHKGRKGPPVLKNCLVRHDGQELTVSATDLEIGCTVFLAGHGSPMAELLDSATGLPIGDAQSPEDFPAVYTFEGATTGSVCLSVADVRRIADHLVPATDDETSRYALGGVLLERAPEGRLYAVATDGRRMHVGRFDATIYGEVPANVIVPGRMFAAFAAAMKATARLAGEKLAGEVVLTLKGDGVYLGWTARDGVAVRVAGRLVEGRFPRWRDVIDQAAAADAQASPMDVKATMAACREAVRATKVATGPARDAWVADRVARGWRSTKPGEYRHPSGVEFSPAGMTCMGCDYRATIATGRPIRLDPDFVAEAVEAAAAFGGGGTVEMMIGDDTSAVTIAGGAWASGGVGLFAVMMPMVRE